MYEMRGIRRLMAAVLIRAIRDVYVEDEFIRKDAADWLQEKSVKHAIQYGLRISHYRVSDWVESGFSEELVSKDKLDHPVFAKMKKFKFED
jgi:hypothetical protein